MDLEPVVIDIPASESAAILVDERTTRRLESLAFVGMIFVLLLAPLRSSGLGAQTAGPAPDANRHTDLGIAVRFGTLGFGLEVNKLLTGHLGARVGAGLRHHRRAEVVRVPGPGRQGRRPVGDPELRGGPPGRGASRPSRRRDAPGTPCPVQSAATNMIVSFILLIQ